jgi:hypothetical protein
LQESGKISPDAIWIFRYPLPELLLFPTSIPPRASPVPEIVADPAIFCPGKIFGYPATGRTAMLLHTRANRTLFRTVIAERVK